MKSKVHKSALFSGRGDKDNPEVNTESLPEMSARILKGIPERVCDYCGKPYHPARRWHRFCSTKCRVAYFILARRVGAIILRQDGIAKARELLSTQEGYIDA